MTLSVMMQALVDYMRENGGVIHRHPGGYWAREGWVQHSGVAFGTSTVQALVARNGAEYIEWKDGRSGRFPIQAKLLPSTSTAGQP